MEAGSNHMNMVVADQNKKLLNYKKPISNLPIVSILIYLYIEAIASKSWIAVMQKKLHIPLLNLYNIKNQKNICTKYWSKSYLDHRDIVSYNV